MSLTVFVVCCVAGFAALFILHRGKRSLDHRAEVDLYGARSSGSKDSRSFSGMQSTLTIVARDEYKPASTLTLLKRSQAAQEMEDDLDEQDDAPDSSNFDD